MSVLARMGRTAIAWATAWVFWICALAAFVLVLALVALAVAVAPLLIVLGLIARFLYWAVTRLAVLFDAERGGRRHCWPFWVDALIIMAIGLVIGSALAYNGLWIERFYALIVDRLVALVGLKPDGPDRSTVVAALDWAVARIDLPVLLAGLVLTLVLLLWRIRNEAARIAGVERGRRP